MYLQFKGRKKNHVEGPALASRNRSPTNHPGSELGQSCHSDEKLQLLVETSAVRLKCSVLVRKAASIGGLTEALPSPLLLPSGAGVIAVCPAGKARVTLGSRKPKLSA